MLGKLIKTEDEFDSNLQSLKCDLEILVLPLKKNEVRKEEIDPVRR